MTDDHLIKDAINFGMGFLSHQKHKLSFGGSGAKMEITPRARAALNWLLENGHSELLGIDSTGREHYQGTSKGYQSLAKEHGIDPFNQERWPSFIEKVNG